jgi:hypothetical protein
MIKERLKFYADTEKDRNKYFCFTITSILEVRSALWRFFDKGWNIRSAWYEKIDTDTGETINQKIVLRTELDEYIKEKTKKGRINSFN